MKEEKAQRPKNKKKISGRAEKVVRGEVVESGKKMASMVWKPESSFKYERRFKGRTIRERE